jgi:exodeoxyribonuclease VII small subunit
MSKKKSDEPSYAELSGELETILDEIESGEIDLDELSDKVERAATLLSQCRKKLAATETKVKKVTAELQTAMDEQEDGNE